VGALSSKSLRAWVVAVAAVVASVQVHAAGLGRLEVKSALGDAFRAEISVLAEKNEIGSLSARMASAEAFQRAGLIYGSAVAAMRVSIEKRAGGEPYIVISSSEKVNEPVVDLLVELAWASGRVTREYTAFIDPPFLIAEREKQRAAAAAAPAPAAAAPSATTEAIPGETLPQPEPLPEPPAPAAAQAPAVPAAEPAPTPTETTRVETIGGTAPTLLEPAFSPERPAGDDYGTVKRGDTLSKIALQTKPADITLEQMLVLLFRSNPEAFAGKNMNRLKTGQVIQLPKPEDYGSVTAAQAKQEVRVQAADWAAYRERLAGSVTEQVPAAAEPAQQAATGQITPKVEEPAKPKTAPKEVLKLSEGAAPSAAAGGTGQQRTRALEEELVARDKAIAEANQRVARLEKTINDLQALLEVKNKGMAELQKQAAGTPAATAPQAPKPAAPEAAKPVPAPATPKPAAPGPDARPAAPPAGSGQETPAAQPAPQAAAPAPKPRPKPPAPPPPPPSLLDQVLEQPLYLGAAALLLLVAGLGGVRALRRRREVKSESEDSAPAKGPAAFASQVGETTRLSSTETDVGLAAPRAGDSSEEVDPLEEAEIFLAYGRDAQAEELLKEALQQYPRRHEIRVKLLEIFAKRKDKTAFETVARDLQQATGGQGEHWERAVRLGYQVDPANGRYAAGKPSGEEPAADEHGAGDEPSPAERLDFDVGLGDDAASTTATDIDLGAEGTFDRTQIINPLDAGEAKAETQQPVVPDFNLDLPALETPGADEVEVSEAKAEPGGNSIDFDFDVSKLGGSEPSSGPAEEKAEDGGAGLDFDIGSFSTEPEAASTSEESDTASSAAPALDLSGISLDLDGTSTLPANAGGKDEKWYEVQTKFDLAKAYQEMGDKDGAREILKEVISEGDPEQRAAAEAVLTSLE
jgi:pilus assembly protein FimV